MWGYAYSCKLGKEYLKALVCKFVYFLQHSETFDILHVFLPLTILFLNNFNKFKLTFIIFGTNYHNDMLY